MTPTNSKLIFIVMQLVFLNGCAVLPSNYAPVITNNPAVATHNTKYHLVKKGDTLYAISLIYDLDYRQLAQWNQIPSPYTIEIGQKIGLSNPNLESPPTDTPSNTKNTTPAEKHVNPSPKAAVVNNDSTDGERVKPLPKTITKTNKKIVTATEITRIDAQNKDAIPLNNKLTSTRKIQSLKNTASKSGSSSQKKSIISIDNGNMLKLNFQWPIKGKVLKYFSQTHNKGIDIYGKMGQNVSAAEAGKVVYSGQGLIGYGNLLIIKHNDLYLSAYANNSQLLVTEGHMVDKGDIIATVGQSGPNQAKSNQASLHFEIRKNGKPVNPLNFLPGK
ncbi:MAG: peptidoglycan DD-metalloendopeptidase family protein [Gammaproteobacteria bacterium]